MNGSSGVPATGRSRPGSTPGHRRSSAIALLVLSITLSAPHMAAQEAQEAATVTVTGTVVDDATGEPVDGVVAVLEALDLTVVTDAQGRFVLGDVPRGAYDIRLIHQDYQRLDGELTIDRPGEFFLGLTPIANPSDGMITGIVGVVTDQASRQPVSDVVVNVDGIGRVTTSGEDGRFELSELAPGRHDVVFTHLGYQSRSVSIEVEAQHAVKVHVELAVDAIALDPIEVAVDRLDRNLRRVGFYQREEDGWGDFLDREDLDYWNPHRLTSALTRFPGVTTLPDPRMPSRSYLGFAQDGRRLHTDRLPRRHQDWRGEQPRLDRRHCESRGGRRGRGVSKHGRDSAAVLGHGLSVRRGAYLAASRRIDKARLRSSLG